MAGPSIVVRVLGDLKSFGGSMDQAGSKAQSNAAKMHGAFSGFLSAVNQTGVLGGLGTALDGIDQAIGQVIEHGKKIGPALAGVGGALIGVGAGLSAVGSKDQAAHQQLQAAVEATGGSYEDYAKGVEAAIKKQEDYGHTAGETQDALTKLVQATHDPTKALALLGEASDVAASKHEDLTSAATQVGKVYNGNTKLLKEYGISIDKTTGKTKDGQTATQALADVTKGQAAASMDTFTGKLDVVKTKIEDLVASIGQKYGPAIQGVGVAAMAAASVVTIASTIMAADWAAAIWPITLVVLAIAGIGVAIYELVTHFKEVIGWLEKNWPYILLILTGPFGAAIAIILKIFHVDLLGFIESVPGRIAKIAATMWHSITDAFNATIHALLVAWQGVINWFTGLGATIARLATGMWHGITDAFGTAIGGISTAWAAVWGWLTGLPRAISQATYGMWNGIWDAFKSVINLLIDGWNSLDFKTPSFKLPFPPHTSFPSVDIGVPHIPHLAQGGLLTSDGLFYGHAGEAVIPAGRQGPAVHIEHATFSDELDVEAFMRKAAWVAQTARI